MEKTRRMVLLLGLYVYLLTGGSVVQGYIISDSDIVATTGNEVASGNGQLDLKLFADSSANISNEYNGFNGDNANTDTPGGGVSTMAEAYITSIGDLRDFYRWTFPDDNGGSTLDSMWLFIDLNQTPGLDVTIEALSVIIDYDHPYGDSRDDPWTNDVLTDLQTSTTDGWAWDLGEPSPIGGTVYSTIDTSKLLPLNSQGAGWADYGIKLGINPFDPVFTDDTPILFYWASGGHDDGGETMFFSGSYASTPEPATLLLVGLGALCLRRKNIL
jgi:hypothetical protein